MVVDSATGSVCLTTSDVDLGMMLPDHSSDLLNLNSPCRTDWAGV